MKKKTKKVPLAIKKAIRKLVYGNWDCECDWHGEATDRIGRSLARAFGIKIRD
jgi:hypothetical protein